MVSTSPPPIVPSAIIVLAMHCAVLVSIEESASVIFSTIASISALGAPPSSVVG